MQPGDAVKAVQKPHAPAAIVTLEADIDPALYIRCFCPAEAAELAEREYHSTRPASWLKNSPGKLLFSQAGHFR